MPNFTKFEGSGSNQLYAMGGNQVLLACFFSFMQPAAVLQIKNVILWHYTFFYKKVCLGRVCIINNVKGEKNEECSKVNLEDCTYLGSSGGQNVVW